jgi:3-oxoacyl-[acyl-carrier-protein] synthase-3
MYAKLKGTGQYLPLKALSNDELAQYVETSDEWIKQRVGIASRRIASARETVVFMATESARRALEMANISAQDIDLIIVATSSAEDRMPSVASQVQRNLEISTGCPAFDISAACSGFLYGLNLVEQYIKTGFAKRVLLIGAERMSRLMDWSDRSTCVLFGDGAGAVLLEASETPGLLATCIHSEGQYRDLLFVDGGLPKDLFMESDSESIDPVSLKMEGNKVFKYAINMLAEVATEVLHKAGVPASQVDWLVPHQANERIIVGTAKKLGLSMDRVILTLSQHGNTSAASVPLALDDGIRSGKIKPGQLVLFEAFGAGFVWGASLMRM